MRVPELTSENDKLTFSDLEERVRDRFQISDSLSLRFKISCVQGREKEVYEVDDDDGLAKLRANLEEQKQRQGSQAAGRATFKVQVISFRSKMLLNASQSIK